MEPLRIGDDQLWVELAPQLELLEDVEAILSFEQVASPAFAGRFEPLTKDSPNFGFTSSAWWVRFTVRNERTDDRELMLRQDYPLIDYLDLWELDADNQWKRHRTGDRLPFAQRPIEHRDFLFPLRIPANGLATYYMRFESGGPVNISLKLYSSPGLLRAVSREQLAYGAYYGGFALLVFYNFFLFAVVRDRAFFYYLLYVTSYGLYMAVHNGLTYQFLWPRTPWWGNQSLILLLGLSLLWGLQFSRTILDARRHSPRLDRFALLLQVGVVVGFGAALFLPYRTAIVPASVSTFVVTALILTMGVVSLLAGHKPARFFMVAWSALLAGVLVYMLKTFGLLPHTPLTQNGFQVGSLMEMALLSLALASRVNEFKQQSLTDPLTSLFNRRFFSEKLVEELQRAKRPGQQLSLLIIDIDHFKQYNDRHGHSEGDKALQVVAACLRGTARKQDLLCRYGGEEFSMILPATDGDAAVQLAERLRRQVETENPYGERLTVSIGIANLDDGAFDTTSEFFDAADLALYTAKEEGRNRVVRFLPNLEKPVRRK